VFFSSFLLNDLFATGVDDAVNINNPLIIRSIHKNENIFNYMDRINGRKFDRNLYKKIVGAANEFKEGDLIVGVSAGNEQTRIFARKLLSNTLVKDLHDNPLFIDMQQVLIWNDINETAYLKIKDLTVLQLKKLILNGPENVVKDIMTGLDSDIISVIVKLMTNEELTKVGQKIFNSLPDTNIGSKGYLGARIQPNSPTDNPEDVIWQVFNGFSYAVGDVLLGTNPTDSTIKSVLLLENTLKDIIETFGLRNKLPWAVLANIDVQYAVEQQETGSTSLFFQSIAGVEKANQTFGISVEKMLRYADIRKNQQYGFYFETGQGSEFTNGHGCGLDMVTHESRKYGLARAISHKMARPERNAWVVVNDVSGFIGPEVFRTKEQLVRACLEDIVMGKLHGLMVGLDICSTLHMPVSLDDMEWCQDRIMAANPGYLMALPTRNDPMLSYITTSFQDHVRIREKFGYKVSEDMWDFFKQIGVIDSNGKPTEHFGDPVWVYYQYKLRKGDKRPQQEIINEGLKAAKSVQARLVPLSIGYGRNIWDLREDLDKQLKQIYNDAKRDIMEPLKSDVFKKIPNLVTVQSNAKNRDDYLNYPSKGEWLSKESVNVIESTAKTWNQEQQDYDVVFVVSDGLNARSLSDKGTFFEYYNELKKLLVEQGYKVAPEVIVVTFGRVRIGYKIGEILFSRKPLDKKPRALIHVLGERPGNGHCTFSTYIAIASGDKWGLAGTVDHDIVKVVSSISASSINSKTAAISTIDLLKKDMN